MDQLLQDTMRVVGVLEVFYVMWLVGMALKWLLNWIWKLASKGGKAIWKLISNIFGRLQVAVTAEEQSEV